MIIQILNYQTQNLIFFILLSLAVILTFRAKKDKTIMSVETTTELKGLAIMVIVLAHIAFGLVSDNRFLQPLSYLAGPGVDLFFFLSGFGLTCSALRKKLPVLKFYLKRLSKVIIPVWIFLVIILILDKLFLNISYPLPEIVKSFLGYFPRADLYKDINSPLWFITPLIFYYLLFPLLFNKKYPEFSAILLFLIGYFLIKYNVVSDYLHVQLDGGVIGLWTLHYMAFPLGILFASILNRLQTQPSLIKLTKKISNIQYFNIINSLILVLLILAWYFVFTHSPDNNASKLTLQLYSILLMFLITIIFILKPLANKFFFWFGIFSFEIYLLHWPLMYHYDFIFKFLPAGLATFLYLIFFILLGLGINKIKQKILNKKTA